MRRLQQALSVAMMIVGVVLAGVSAGLAGRADAASVDQRVPPLPTRVSETGLYVAGSTRDVRAENLAFTPQYPLWSDGATKRRWLYLPPGTSIDATNPNAWDFPRGTRLWKEFSVGTAIETRMIERLPDGSWRFATYAWNDAGTDAELVSGAGRTIKLASAPKGRYVIPSEADCRACHDGAAVPVLGVSALQLSFDRDPLALNADAMRPDSGDLRALIARGWLRNFPPEWRTQPPRIAANSGLERAVLGYLHGNCSHCHNASDAGAGVPVDLNLAHDVTDSRASVERTLRSLTTVSRYKARSAAATHIVTPGAAETSVIALRMRSRNPQIQMPPLGSEAPDVAALALIERWINLDLKKEP